ncbi:MAG: hypothetical protein IT578_05015 [Verrucomicrobiae bacterium]|nr:hypothetical protein [Verrucomicrobiae bacterium]
MLIRSRCVAASSSTPPSKSSTSRIALIRVIRRLSGCAPDLSLLQKLHAWIEAPRCLWPTGLDSIALRAADTLGSGKPLDGRTRLLLRVLGPPPPQEIQSRIERYEAALHADAGRHLIRAKHKHAILQRERERCSALAAEWRAIKAAFDVTRYRVRDGRIRRRYMQNQDLRMDLQLTWTNENARFFAVFNTFCHRWNLDGMKGDTPVLLRSAAHVTPFGTWLFVPAYWSLDPRRDFFWNEIRALHHSRSLKKQGTKLGRNQRERRKEAMRAKRLMEQAVARGLKGSRRDDWVMRRLNWDVRTEPRALRRLLKDAL